MLGSRYEFHNNLPVNFCFSKDSTYTDDTVLLVATADTLLNNESYAKNYLDYARAYPNRGYGGSFDKWVKNGGGSPYNSYGNGSIMRSFLIGWIFDDINKTAEEAKKSAECTHSHKEGIKGAIAIACSIWLIRKGYSKKDVKSILEKEPLNYDLSRGINDFDRTFDVTCQGTIPRCMAIFFETNSFEEAMVAGIKMGGDVDTNCCIVGSLCDAQYGLPKKEIIQSVYERIPRQMANIVTAFTKKYIDKNFVEPEYIATKASTLEDALSSLFS